MKSLDKDWLEAAREITEIYEAGKQDENPFNILYSNTETLLPALYNSTPRPEVSARYSSMASDRRLDAAVAQTSERLLEYTADTNSGEYETFDEATRDAVLQALVPGQGDVRVRFKEDKGYQEICVESVAFDRFIWGYSRKWQNVPWVAYGHDLNKADFERMFPDFAKTQKYKDVDWKVLEEKAQNSPSIWDPDLNSKGKKKEPTLLVWEVWEYAEKGINYVCEEFEEEFIRQDKYPFNLKSRFPSPKPLQFIKRVNSLTPRPLYEEYRTQAEELNDLTRRLKRVVKAIRVRGVYHPALDVLKEIFDQDSDNALIPAEQAQVIADAGGLDKFIWLVPVDMLVQTALSLYDAREKCKQTIYEIMGIGDVLRGTSVASETARAQEIKNQWGSLRIKRLQKDVMVFCRDIFRITLEFAANKYSPLTFKQITSLPYLFDAQKVQVQQQVQMAQQQAQQMQQQWQMAAQQAQAMGQPPPQQPPPPPEIPNAFLLQFPSWENIIGVLRSSFERQYRIDIETNSTVDLEATEDKAAIGEFMNAFGQMSAGLEPMVASGRLPFEASKVIMGETFRRFRFGRRVQDALEMMQPPQQSPDMAIIQEQHKNEMLKVQAEAKRQVGEMQETVLEMTGEIERLKTENAAMKHGGDLQKQASEVKLANRENQLRTTFQGTLKQQKDAADQKVRAAEDTVRRSDMQQAHDQLANSLEERIKAVREEVMGLREKQVSMREKDPGLVLARKDPVTQQWEISRGGKKITAKKEDGQWRIG